MARKLDLRTGRPVWLAQRRPAVATRRLTQDISTDILIVGMGISGAMMAEALVADGHDVVCIDRRGPIRGSTPATTALVQFEIDQPLSHLVPRIGRDAAEQAWRRSLLSLGNLDARISQLRIDCDLVRRPSLYLDGNVLGPGDLREEAFARRRAGLYADYLTPAALEARYGITGRSAILSQGNLALDPMKLTAGLLRAAAAGGCRMFAPVEATAFAHHAGGVDVATANGPVIRAGHVVLCTGYELAADVPAAPHEIISTWAIATRPQPRALWPEQSFIWEAADPYLYMRTTPDGRVICGGEDEPFQDEERRDAMIARKTEEIVRKLGRLFPRLDPRPEFAWAGAFGSTSTGLPLIGAVPRKPRMFAVMGYGGNGITYSRIASEIIAGELAGRSDSDADLFSLGKEAAPSKGRARAATSA